jgi:two-component system KDP operon response regulator KdpE
MSAFEAQPVHRLLIVEDEPQIRRAVKNALAAIAERIVEAATGSEGIDAAATEQPDLVILDLGLPDLPGIEVCREIRRWAQMPIVVLSARHSEQEKVDLLNAGADDYVTKPFSTQELAARVRAQLRRASSGPVRATATLTLGDGLLLDFPRRTVSRHGEPIRLTPLEWEILQTLAREAGRTLTHQQIFDAAWGRAFGNPQQYLRVHITNLRRKIELDPAHPQIIVTDPGVGYRCELPR